LFVGLTSLEADEPSPDFGSPSRSIDQAVAEFNQETANNPIGKDQPPLTRDEFLAGLRFGLDKVKDPAFANHVREILKTERVSANDELHFMTGYRDFDQSGYDIKAWRIEFIMSDGSLTTSRAVPGVMVIIREKLISAEPAAPPDPQEQALSSRVVKAPGLHP